MKIGLDARFLTHPQVGGFKTYTENLISALAEIDSENEYILYVDRPPNQQTRVPFPANFSIRVIPGSGPLLGMPWREQIKLSRQAICDKLDLLHSPSLTAPLRLTCPSVVTIHDMIWFLPGKFSRGKTLLGKRKLMEWYYQAVPKFAARRATAVITVSYAARDTIVQHLGLPADRIFVTHEAANPIYCRVNEPAEVNTIRQKYNLASNFILAIGSADPRKNITTLVHAYALLPASLRKRYHLAIVWTHSFLAPDLAGEVDKLGLTDHLRFLTGISNEELVLLYNAATLFAFPSRYEGFGLPPLEAMACGTPVVAANNSSIPEIVGEAAVLVETENVEAIASAISRVLSDQSLQKNLSTKGSAQAACFSWTKCALETVEVYRKVLL
jgi:glycosyltransferase involved in cell wall biosynthesis